MAVITQANPSNPSPTYPQPLGSAIAITKSDDDTYEKGVTVYVGTTGNVAIVPMGGQAAVTFVGLPAGAVLPCRAYKVMSTNTTASNLVGIY